MEDGAPAHFALHVRVSLCNDFTGRWTGRGGKRELLLPSPDLIAGDLFFCGFGRKGKPACQNQEHFANWNNKFEVLLPVFLVTS
jgi:hypothetical protein